MKLRYSLVLLATSLVAQTQYTTDQIVVTSTHVNEPLELETDPKKPRVPIPSMDGGGYLKNITGFSLSKKGGAGNDPVFRGLGGSRLPMMMDQTNFGGACGGRMDASGSYVFPESYDKITVIKGPQNVKYGGLIAGGVLFERTPLRFSEFQWFSDVSLMVASNSRYDILADTGAGDERGSIRAIATRSYSNDFKDGDGNKVHSRYYKDSATIIGAFTPDSETLFQVTGDISDGKAAYSHSPAAGNDGRTLDRKALNVLFEKEDVSQSISKIEARAWYSYVDHIMDNFTMRPADKYTVSNPDSKNIGARAQMELLPTDESYLTIGANYDKESRTLRSKANQSTIEGANEALGLKRAKNMNFDRLNLFAQGEYDLDSDKKVLGGYSFAKIKTHRFQRGTVVEADDSNSLHSAFFRYEQSLDEFLKLYAGVGLAQRAPDYWERMKRFELKKEQNRQLDFGFIYKADEFQVDSSFFVSSVKDYILLNTAGAKSKNIDANMYGVEIDASWDFKRNWKLFSSLAYTYGVNKTDDKPLAQMPPLEFKLGVDYDDSKLLGGFQARAASRQNRTDSGWGNVIGQDLSINDGKSAGFATFSAYIGYKPTKKTTIVAGVDNILDKTYAEHISRANMFGQNDSEYDSSVRVNEAGRTFWLKAQMKF